MTGKKPMICVPLLVPDMESLEERVGSLARESVDMVEWRLDGLTSMPSIEDLPSMVGKLREWIDRIPILLTYRTLSEGGKGSASHEMYFKILVRAIESGMIDLVDLEHTMYEKAPNLAKEVIGTAKKQGVQVLVSKHDFKETPDLQTLEKWIAQMDQAGGDILKLAVMANSKNDAIRVMEVAVAQKQKNPDCPIIFIAMGAYGMITRIMAEFMDSFLIFANAGELTAPGQLPLEKARVLVDLIHEIKGFEN